MKNDEEKELGKKRTRKTPYLSSKVAIVGKGDNGETKYTCVACSEEFKDKDKLQFHLLTHYDEYKFVCGVCGKGLKRREHLDRHMQEHSGIRPHVCPDCGKGFKRKEHLNIHTAIHSGVKILSCPVCNKKFNRKDHLHKHVQTHNKHFMEQSVIPMRDLALMGIKTEVVHEYEEEYNPIISDVIGSDQAGENDPDTSNVGSNQSITSNESYDPTSAYELAQQFLASHDESISFDQYATNGDVFDPVRPHVCPLCGKSYKRKDHLKIHSWTHKKKEKFCTDCGKDVKRAKDAERKRKERAEVKERQNIQELLRIRQRSAQRSKAYRQRKKTAAFHTSDQLLVHVNLSHIRSFEQQEMFGNQLNVQIVNQKESWPLANKGSGNHECTICHRKFKRKQHLKTHYNVHLKHQNQAIWCSTCKEGFYNSTIYENHPCFNRSQEESEDEQNGETESPQQDAKKENNPMELLEVVVNEFPPGEATGGAVGGAGEAAIPSPRRVYVCKFCSKSFKRKDHYKIHQYIHTGVKTVFCPDCRKGFYRKDHLQKHMIVHARLKTKDIKVKKEVPDLFPIEQLPHAAHNNNKEVVPEITIHAPSNTKLRVPLKIKVPYQMVMSMDNGEKRAFTVDPLAKTDL